MYVLRSSTVSLDGCGDLRRQSFGGDEKLFSSELGALCPSCDVGAVMLVDPADRTQYRSGVYVECVEIDI